MGVIVTKENEKNSELSRRISADLRSKQEAQAKDSVKEDFVEDSDYARELKKTGRFAWVWVVLIVLAIISMVIIVTPA